MEPGEPTLEPEPGAAPGRTSGVSRRRQFAVLFVLAAIALAVYLIGPAGYRAIMSKPAPANVAARSGAASPGLPAQSIKLSEKQIAAIKAAPVEYRDFHIEKTASGSIDFNRDRWVQVFPPFQGKIIAVFTDEGRMVTAGAPLFTIDSPDLNQAESTLIQAAGVLQLTTRVLTRARKLVKAGGGAEKDLEQAISDQQTAEGNLKAARNAVRIFGKDDAEIDRIVADRRIDSSLIVPCPITGTVTDRTAAIGQFVQPGTAPAPISVADLSTMWMNAFVVESEIPSIALGQEVDATVAAYPDRIFQGIVIKIGASVDPATRRLFVRSAIKDPERLLRSGMFARFVIRTGTSLHSPAIPLSGIVREGDGTMSAWITTDGSVFTRRTVRIGLQQNGYHQILEGVQAGEMAVTDGAIFLSNILAGGATD
ncbi:MAG: efflux RND transporter periplasmic adaptor subunit [Methylocella sp.]